MFGLEIRFRSLHFFQDRKCRTACPQWCILKCNRSAKDGHDAIASKALNDTALLMYCCLHQLRQLAHKIEGRLLPRLLREGREAHQIGEKHCDLPAFSVHAALRGKKLYLPHLTGRGTKACFSAKRGSAKRSNAHSLHTKRGDKRLPNRGTIQMALASRSKLETQGKLQCTKGPFLATERT